MRAPGKIGGAGIDPVLFRSVHRTHREHAVGAGRRSRDVSDDTAPIWDRLANFVGKVEYAGDWNLSPEWYGTQGGGWGRSTGQVVFEDVSCSGRVTVTAHPASSFPGEGRAEWRVLRFNEKTRQSVARIVDGVVDPRCLATEYLKTVVAVIAAVTGARETSRAETTSTTSAEQLATLCIGIGGGSIVMFLRAYFPELVIDSVEIDPVVVSAARCMGADFDIILEDANTFVTGRLPGTSAVPDGTPSSSSNPPYELVYIDAFDGDDCVPKDLCGSDFAGRVASELSVTGTLVVNLHADDPNWQRTARVYHTAIGGQSFTCTCKTQGNVILCCTRAPGLVSALGASDEEAQRQLRAFASSTYFGRSLPFRCGDRVTEGYSRVM